VVATFTAAPLTATTTTTTRAASTTTTIGATTTTRATSTTTTTITSTTTTTQPPAGIALVQSGAVRGTGAASVSQAFPGGNTAGNLIVAFVRMSSTSQTVRVTDTAGNSYLDVVSQTQTADGHQIHILYASNVKGGTNTVTATFSATNNHPWLAIYEYSGVNAVDRTAHSQGNGTAANSGPTATTAAANA